MEFTGPDASVLRELSDKAEAIMKSSPYVDPYTVQNSWDAPSRQISVAYSSQSATRAGVNRSDVGNSIQAATDGYTVGVISDRENLVPINIVVRNSDGSKIEDL